MQEQLSEILDNILGLLLLEGSYEVVENDEELRVKIDTPDAGRLIGFRGESLDSFQLLINQLMAAKIKQSSPDDKAYKRVILDVGGWKENKEQDLKQRAQGWAEEVKESGEEMELEPMPSWQRRIVHMIVQETDGVDSESVGEGKDRHLLIKPSK